MWLVVSPEIHKARIEMQHIFGPAPERHDYDALCSYDEKGAFGLFFSPNTLTSRTIAHEIFHLTHAILKWCNCPFDKDHDEYAAMLCEYITDWVMQKIK